MRTSFSQTTVITIGLLFVLLGGAQADLRSFDFSGTLDRVYDKEDYFGGQFDKGTEYYGTFWFDPELLKKLETSVSSSSIVNYDAYQGDENAMGMTVTLGDQTFTTGVNRDSTMYSQTYNTSQSSSQENRVSYSLSGYLDSKDENTTQYLGLSFSGYASAMPLDENSLMNSAFDLSDKNVSGSFYYVSSSPSTKGSSSSTAYALGSVASLSKSSGVPEPATLTLLGLGGGMILFRTQRHPKRHRA